MQRLDEETRSKAKACKRYERREEGLRVELASLQSEVARKREELESLRQRSKEAINTRDSHLAAAEAQVCIRLQIYILARLRGSVKFE